MKLCTCAQSMALVTRTTFQLEILIRSTMSAIHKFRENILESSRNVTWFNDILRYSETSNTREKYSNPLFLMTHGWHVSTLGMVINCLGITKQPLIVIFARINGLTKQIHQSYINVRPCDVSLCIWVDSTIIARLGDLK